MIIGHHHRAVTSPREGRHARQRGAALVEFAIVAMFLVTISAGAFDYGMAWRVGLATNESARTGARVGSALGTNYLADWYALSGARAALQNSGRLKDVQRVVIYRSDTVTGEVPAACTTATTTTEKCNILTGNQFRALQQSNVNTTTGCITTATVANWCPSSRNNVQLTAEYYGVWIQNYYRNQFRMISSGTTINRDAVMRLEPTAS